MSSLTLSNPKLLKARQKHTRWFALFLVGIVLFSRRIIAIDSLLDEVIELFGLVAIVLCVLGRSYCSAFIGGIKNEGIMRLGPYSVVRNPLYVFSFFGVVGIGLLSDNVVFFVLMVATFFTYYKYVIDREEAYLTEKFGEEYLAYKAEVPRWWPNFSLWVEPEEMVTRPYFIRHTMMDAAVFFIAIPAFALLERLHEYGYIPTFLTLP